MWFLKLPIITLDFDDFLYDIVQKYSCYVLTHLFVFTIHFDPFILNTMRNKPKNKQVAAVKRGSCNNGYSLQALFRQDWKWILLYDSFLFKNMNSALRLASQHVLTHSLL